MRLIGVGSSHIACRPARSAVQRQTARIITQRDGHALHGVVVLIHAKEAVADLGRQGRCSGCGGRRGRSRWLCRGRGGGRSRWRSGGHACGACRRCSRRRSGGRRSARFGRRSRLNGVCRRGGTLLLRLPFAGRKDKQKSNQGKGIRRCTDPEELFHGSVTPSVVVRRTV